MYGLQGPFPGFLEGLKDTVIGKRPYLATPGRMAKMLQNNWLIAGVRIDNRTGEFVRSGGANHVGHWIVVEAVTPFGLNNGDVRVYNPFPNNYQTITFRLLLESMGSGDPDPRGRFQWALDTKVVACAWVDDELGRIDM